MVGGFDDAACLVCGSTFRRLMGAVVIIGITLGVTIERGPIQGIAIHHRAELQKVASRIKMFAPEESDWLPIE